MMTVTLFQTDPLGAAAAHHGRRRLVAVGTTWRNNRVVGMYLVTYVVREELGCA